MDAHVRFATMSRHKAGDNLERNCELSTGRARFAELFASARIGKRARSTGFGEP